MRLQPEQHLTLGAGVGLQFGQQLRGPGAGADDEALRVVYGSVRTQLHEAVAADLPVEHALASAQ